MASKYKAKLTLVARKHHTCFNCGSQFSYPLTREITCEDATPDTALQKAQAEADEKRTKEIDSHPCPKCGFIQPDMVAEDLSGNMLLGGALAFIGLPMALLVGWLWSVWVSAWLATGIVALTWYVYYRATVGDPNSDLDKNLELAKDEVGQEKLRFDTTGTAAHVRGELPSAAGPLQWLTLALIALGILVAAASAMVPLVLGWPTNSHWQPAIIGPGDTSTYYYGSISSLKGLWRGSASVTATGAALPQPLSLNAVTKNEDWGNSIRGKRLSNSNKKMWVSVEFPNDLALVRKSLNLKVAARTTYPYKVGRSFEEKEETFESDTEVKLATPLAGKLYWRMWWIGQVGLFALLFIGCFILHAGLRRVREAALPNTAEDLSEVPVAEAE